MNFRFVISQLGMLIMLLSGIMLATAALFFMVGALRDLDVDRAAKTALFATGAVGLAVGLVTWKLTHRGSPFLGRREALLLVASSWIVGAAFAGLPFYAWALVGGHDEHPFHNYVDCYFEAMSGFTTTGATILPEISTVPDSLLLWRAITHWLGGLGIVVLFVAVLPSLGVGGKRLFQVESPGPSPEGVRPHIRQTARVLWYIYLGFTSLAIVAYLIGGMSIFDAVCHAFSVVSTGGFDTRDASVGAFGSAVAQSTTLLMLMAGVNFGLYYQMTQGNLRAVWKDTELRVYLAMKIMVIAIIMADLVGLNLVTTAGTVLRPTLWTIFEQAAFVTAAQHTGTGFGIGDYNLWPSLSKTLLIGLMFVGGCAGSTAGGVKVIRFWIGLKILLGELERSFRPNVVPPLRIGGRVVEPEMKLAAVGYIIALLGMFVLGAILLAVFEPPGPNNDLVTIFTASLSTVCNVGPGLGAVGATGNYAWFTDASKLVMCVLMALGRLEMFAILVLFMPSFWKQD